MNTIQERIFNMLNDDEFKQHCIKLSKQANFESDFKMVEKIANIDISNIRINHNLIENFDLFSKSDLIVNAQNFYSVLDKISPDTINFNKIVNDNIKYLKMENKTNVRSHCGTHNNLKEIYVNVENRITDSTTLIHELGHSFCEPFLSGKFLKDRRIDEIPTVLLERLAVNYLEKQYPQYKNNFIENEKFTMLQNVKKARECLIDALVVKVMTGEMQFNDVIKQYGNLFKNFPYMIDNVLTKKENYEFNDIMFEKKYLIPTALVQKNRQNFKNNPNKTVENLKEIIENLHNLTEEEIIANFGFKNREELIDDYVNNFPKMINNFNNMMNKS